MSRRGVSQQHRWPAWGWALLAAFATLSFSACIDDVVIPECFLNGTCPEAGAGGDAEHPGSGSGGDLVDVAGQGTGGTGSEAGAAGQGGEAVEPDGCTSCRLLPEHLAPACAGKPYQAKFNIEGGVPPYSWRLTPQPNGWTISGSPEDPEAATAILRSSQAPNAATELTLVVTDARNQHLTLTLPLAVRTNCWFAYTALESEVPELRLIDPLVGTTPWAKLEHGQGAYDFQFSPDGAFLAYRYGQDAEHPKGRHLSLVDLASLKERDVVFEEDQVLSYAWSPNSEALAAAFQKDGKSFLSAVLVPLPGSEDSPASLVSTQAPVDSELYWVGNDYVVFHAPDTGQAHARTAHYAAFSGAGFGAPVNVDRFLLSGLNVQPTNTGFFLITSLSTLYHDLSSGVGVDVQHPPIALVAPSGRYTGALSASGLPQLFPAETADQDTILESTQATQSCSRLLAWAGERERLACLADVSNGDGSIHGEIRIFDVSADRERLEGSTLQGFCADDVDDTGSESCLAKRGGYSYAGLQATGSARAFSPSGRYFAFARQVDASTYVYWADLNAAPLKIAEPLYFGVPGNQPLPVGFLFSPDERFLLVQRGRSISVVELETGAEGFLSTKHADNLPCSEDFLAAPAAYCGNTEPTGVAQWAANSRAMAFSTTEGFTIVDFSEFPMKDAKVVAVAKCAAECSGQFGFQP